MFGSLGGCRPRARSVFWRCESVLDRSCAGRKPAAREHEQVGSWQRRRPRARSVLRCHGVLALREGPLTGAVVQDESQLQEDTSKFPLDLLSLLIDKIYLGLLCCFLFNYLQQDIIYYCYVLLCRYRLFFQHVSSFSSFQFSNYFIFMEHFPRSFRVVFQSALKSSKCFSHFLMSFPLA